MTTYDELSKSFDDTNDEYLNKLNGLYELYNDNNLKQENLDSVDSSENEVQKAQDKLNNILFYSLYEMDSMKTLTEFKHGGADVIPLSLDLIEK